MNRVPVYVRLKRVRSSVPHKRRDKVRWVGDRPYCERCYRSFQRRNGGLARLEAENLHRRRQDLEGHRSRPARSARAPDLGPLALIAEKAEAERCYAITIRYSLSLPLPSLSFPLPTPPFLSLPSSPPPPPSLPSPSLPPSQSGMAACTGQPETWERRQHTRNKEPRTEKTRAVCVCRGIAMMGWRLWTGTGRG